MKLRGHLDSLDQQVGEAEAIARVVLHVAETAEPHERDRLRPSAVTLLHLMIDRTRAASREIGSMQEMAMACDFSRSHGWKKVARFLLRSTRRNR